MKQNYLLKAILLLLCIVGGASFSWADSTVDDLQTISTDYTFIADNITSDGTVGLTANTLYDGGRIFTPTGNSVATNKGSSTFAGASHLNSLRIKNTQDQLCFKVAGPCTVTFYTQSHNQRGLQVGSKAGETQYGSQTVSTSKWDCNITAAGVVYLSSFEGDFYIAGFEIKFPEEWPKIDIDLRSGQLGDGLAKYLTIDGTSYTYSDTEPTSYNAYLTANSFNGGQHGYVLLTATIPVEAGNYKLTVGTCQYHSTGYNTVTFKDASTNETLNLVDADGNTVTSLDASGTCDGTTTSDHHVSVWYHADASTTIKIVFANYTPYFCFEKVESVPTVTIPFSLADEEENQNTPTGWTAVDLPTNLPTFTAANVFDITAAPYNASTTSDDNTTAIQAALDAAAAAGGGMVVIPAGTFISGSLQMGSKTVLHLNAGATLKMKAISTFPTDDNGYHKMEAPFITGKDGASDIVIEGESRTTSIIDGQGAPWWDEVEAAKNASKSTTRQALIRFWQGSRYLFRNFRIQNAPNTNICIGRSGSGSHATAHDITIINPASTASDPSHNTDGFPIWTQYVNIYNCEIDTGDDNVVTDSDAQYVHVWNCDMKAGHGASLGSYTQNMHDILYEDLTFTGTDCGFRLKSNIEKSGDVYNITFRNCTMTNVTSPIVITSWYDTLPESPAAAAASPEDSTATTPYYHDILIQNVTVSGHTTYVSSAKNGYGIFIYGRPESKVRNVTFDNVNITHSKGIKMNFCEGITFYDNCSFEVSNTNQTDKNAVADEDLENVMEEKYQGTYSWKAESTQPFSVTWSMANGATSTAVASVDDVLLSSSWDMSSKIVVNSTATYGGNTLTKFNPTENHSPRVERNNDYYVEWTFRPYPGLTFTPTSVSFDAVKCGTDDPTIDVDFTDGTGVTQQLATNEAINRDGNDVSDTNPAINHSYTLTTASNGSENAVKLRIYIGKCVTGKQVALGRIVISGTVSGEKAALETYTVTFANNDADAYGTVPASVEVNQYESTTMPVNQTLYKSGYTLTGWNDGTNTYAIGADYTPTASVTMHPVFTANTNTLSDLAIDKTVTWYFGKSNGAIDYSGSANANVQQVNIGGSAIDLGIKMPGGTNEGRTDEWLNNQQKDMMVPVVKGAIVKAKVYYTNDASFNGETITYNADIHGTQGNVVFSYTYTGDAPAEIAVNVGNQFLSYISVTYPGTGDAWANFQSFEMDLTNGSYITSSETSNTTIGFKKDGENIVRTTADDSDAIGTLTGMFHTNEHGLQNFSMSVAVPGYVKISAGTCAWGGNLTITGSNAFSKTINTNTGACFHQNKTANKVVAYYNIDEGTTLTIAGGNYMPYIAVESVDAIPTAYTVNFYNGETLVQTKEVYDGTTLGTLPTAPSIADGKHFRGWYTATDYTGVKATQATVVTSNINYYAYVMDVNIVNGFILADNSGTNAENGQTLLNAIEYCSENASDNVQKIYVPNGTYDLGTACRTEVKKNIAILGESREGVLIQNHPTAPGIQATSVLRLTGDNVYLQNLTLRCDVSYEGSTTSGVGVALEINGDKSICNNVELQGNQDTYYSNGSNSQLGYFKGGRIEGTVDYICGGGNMWFEGTELYNNARTNADVILAPSTAAATTYGYVLNNCTIDAASNQAERFNIARPWQNSPAATLINCTFKQNPSSAGYTNMTNGLVLRFHEYGSVDADGNPITGHTLTACSPAANSDAIYLDAVGNYTYATVLGAWDPEAIIALYSTSLTSNIGKWASFTPAFDCVLSDDNTKAYIITSINENSLTGETVSVLKAGEGYFINTPDASQTLKADITYKDADDVTGTMLVGCTADTPLTNDGNTKYFLGVKDNVAGLYYVGAAGITIPAGKCYLQSNSAQARSFMELIIDDDSTTGINAIGQSDNVQSDNWYDLQGRQIVKSSNRQMKKGLYIVNGKKVVIK